MEGRPGALTLTEVQKRWGETVRSTDRKWDEMLTHARSVVYSEKLRHHQASKQPASIYHQQTRIPEGEEGTVRLCYALRN